MLCFSTMRNSRNTRLLFACAIALSLFVTNTTAQQKPAAAANAPTFKVDPSWPLEMPNHWIMGAVTGVFVDAKQHIWVTHLP